MRTWSLAVLAVLLVAPVAAQTAPLTRADTLRGSVTPERAWWDVTHYDLDVRVQPADSSLSGRVGIAYRVVGPAREMQIDLQQPLAVDSVVQAGRRLDVRRDGDVVYVRPPDPQPVGSAQALTVHYHGRPRVAANAPWDGGFVWTRDAGGAPFIATAVQGLGASAWWPTKDTQTEEPDSMRIAITVPDPMVNVSNGRLRSRTPNGDGTTTWEWIVTSPINNYNVAVNAGAYAHFSDTMAGEAGLLTLDYWPLARNEAAARLQFRQTPHIVACFEHWFGPFPWYADGLKLVETPHLGMEHQSAVAYGNGYQNGYRGRDLSGSGTGLQWDFIIVHELAHEWWGNSLTTADIADMWVHEGFGNYAENLYVECQQGRDAGARYVIGTRAGIRNDIPIVGPYGVNREGSGDMYPKGGNMLHTIRQVVADDERWRSVLRGLQSTFRHQIVTGRQVQDYISEQTGRDFSRVFDQYLTTTQIPVLEYRVEGATLHYRWADVVPGFDLPVRAALGGDAMTWLRPTEAWQQAPLAGAGVFRVDENFYVLTRNVAGE